MTGPGARIVLLETGPTAADVTVERLRAQGIDAARSEAVVSKAPALVRVHVPAGEVEAARALLAEWERVTEVELRGVGCQVVPGLLGSLAVPAGLVAWFVARGAMPAWGAGAIVGSAIAGITVWVMLGRRSDRGPRRDGARRR